MLEKISETKCFEGKQQRFSHRSEVNQCTMHFSVFLPEGVSESNPAPVVYWLSGLTCTDENFVQKAGAQRCAAELGLIIVAPDTSPRGDDVPDDPEAAWDFGLGAGFYVDATKAPWSKHYNMYSYIVDELPDLIVNHFPCTAKSSIMGHSMGGHGALICALKNSERYSCVSAFAPIVNPAACPWGEKAFSHYLGDTNKESWKEYDCCELIRAHGLATPMLVDQGSDDNFLEEQLLTKNLSDTLTDKNVGENDNCTVRIQNGYDHSYFFIASFIGEHLAFHKKHLI